MHGRCMYSPPLICLGRQQIHIGLCTSEFVQDTIDRLDQQLQNQTGDGADMDELLEEMEEILAKMQHASANFRVNQFQVESETM